MILTCHEIKKSFGESVIIKQASFQMETREKVGLVGINGAGKSTLLKMIFGELSPDQGTISLAKGATIGYLAQQQDLQSNATLYEEVKRVKQPVLQMEQQLREMEQEMKRASGTNLSTLMDAYNRLMTTYEAQNGYAVESEIVGVLKGLGFTEADFQKPVTALSGGQKTRASLCKLLLTKPDLLLLDEPTNHLDLPSISWLENYLLNYDGAVLLVSHDRYFLDQVVTKILEIENGTLSCYQGNYHDFALKKEQLLNAQLKAYMKQQQEIKRQEEVIDKLRSFNREKSIKRAESREKKLEKMSPIEKPTSENTDMRLQLVPACESGKDVLTVEGLGKSFSSQTLFQNVSFSLQRGEHVAIIGENGTGKTTLLKILTQEISADTGSFTLGANVHIGYYDQELQLLNQEQTIFSELSNAYPSLDNTTIRNVLAAFLFTGDDVWEKIGDLSGGERARVSLAKLMLSNANFLILDEPTNHLDINSREILEQALNNYTGTILYVSHDRYFINQTASRILELVHQTFVNYIGNYDYYLEKKEALSETAPSKNQKAHHHADKNASQAKQSWQEQKEARAREQKRQHDLSQVEERISLLEDRSQEINASMTLESVYTNPQKCQELAQEKAEIEQTLEDLYQTWEQLVN